MATPPAAANSSRTLGRRLVGRLEPLPDLSLRGRIEVEREQALVRVEGDLRLLERVGGLCEREEGLLVLRLDLDDLLVRRERLRRSGLVQRRGGLELGGRLGALRIGDRILGKCLTELSRRRLERRADAGLRLR